MKNNNINGIECVRERFRFLFDDLDIDEFRRITLENEKECLMKG